MILRANIGTLDLIPGVFVKVAISIIILPCALAFSRSRTNSFSAPSLRLFQMKAGMMYMDVPSSRDNSTTNNKKQQSNVSITTTSTDSRQQMRRERFLASLPQIKFTQKDIWMGDEMDKTILQSVIPNMLNYIVVPIVSSVDTFWVGRLGVALALAGQGKKRKDCFRHRIFILCI